MYHNSIICVRLLIHHELVEPLTDPDAPLETRRDLLGRLLRYRRDWRLGFNAEAHHAPVQLILLVRTPLAEKLMTVNPRHKHEYLEGMVYADVWSLLHADLAPANWRDEPLVTLCRSVDVQRAA